MANYRISKDAKVDLNRIYRLYQAVDDIREGYRRSVCGTDSIYYRIEENTVEIMCILGQQDIDEWI